MWWRSRLARPRRPMLDRRDLGCCNFLRAATAPGATAHCAPERSQAKGRSGSELEDPRCPQVAWLRHFRSGSISSGESLSPRDGQDRHVLEDEPGRG